MLELPEAEDERTLALVEFDEALRALLELELVDVDSAMLLELLELDTTGAFANWVASELWMALRTVESIQLVFELENPEKALPKS